MYEILKLYISYISYIKLYEPVSIIFYKNFSIISSRHYWEIVTLEHELAKRGGNARAWIRGGGSTIERDTIGTFYCSQKSVTLRWQFCNYYSNSFVFLSIILCLFLSCPAYSRLKQQQVDTRNNRSAVLRRCCTPKDSVTHSVQWKVWKVLNFHFAINKRIASMELFC